MTHAQLGTIISDLDRSGWDLQLSHHLHPDGSYRIVTVRRPGAYFAISGEPLDLSADALYTAAVYYDEIKGGRKPPERGTNDDTTGNARTHE